VLSNHLCTLESVSGKQTGSHRTFSYVCFNCSLETAVLQVYGGVVNEGKMPLSPFKSQLAPLLTGLLESTYDGEQGTKLNLSSILGR